MFFSILSGLAICTFTLPAIWNGIAGRIKAHQMVYAWDNRVRIRAAADNWRLSYPAMFPATGFSVDRQVASPAEDPLMLATASFAGNAGNRLYVVVDRS